MATTKITFAMTFCARDAALAKINAARLQALYPAATVLAIDDNNTQLKLAGHAGQWTERMMQQAMATSPDIVIKLDPDTKPLVAVSVFPTSDVFGQMAPVGTYYPKSTGIISGGCIGFQAAAVSKILASGLLTNAKYNEKPYACEERRYGYPRATVVLNDPIVSDVVKQLGLSEGVWEGLDLMMSWEPTRAFKANATFVHPVKE
jgi:hypothetical protein